MEWADEPEVTLSELVKLEDVEDDNDDVVEPASLVVSPPIKLLTEARLVRQVRSGICTLILSGLIK